MVNLFKTPKAPDPYQTAAAQTQQNQQTANYTQGLNMINQVTPDGNLTYSGVNNGQPGSVTAVQTLTPEQQALKAQQQQFDSMSNQTAINQLGSVQQRLSQPFTLNNEGTEARLYELATKRLDPRFARESQGLEQDLMDRGIRPGSEAYNTMRGQFTEGKNDAYNQLLLTGRQQANAEQLQERQQPINEMIALMNGQQLAAPQYANTPQTQVAGTDLAGMIYKGYDAKVANQNAMLGGLFGLGSAGIGAAGSYFKPTPKYNTGGLY